ncbi:MAG: amidohydrolase [Oscillospiraceae bacterium]|nr:amidohydrolase [Oscillospiraceae bacterium]
MRVKILIALSLVLLTIFTQGESPEARDVFLNGIIYTADGENWHQNPQESIVIGDDGRILFVGNSEEASLFIGENTRVHDLDGNVVFPGFLDTHTHPPGTSLSVMTSIYIPVTAKKEEALSIIREYIANNPEQDSYWGMGFSTGIGDSPIGPKKEWLDEIESEKPIILTSSDGHNMWLNSKAFELNGITKDTVYPTGTIHKNEEGELSGMLTDTFNILTMEQVFTPQQQKSALEDYLKNMHNRGYTGGQYVLMSLEEANAGKAYADYLIEMAQIGSLQTRASLMHVFTPDDDFDEALDYVLKMQEMLTDFDTFALNTAKFFVDGVVEGGTAYLWQPYANNQERGFPPDYASDLLWDNNVLKEHFSTLMRHGIQIHIHAIGDRATSETIDALAYAHENNPGVYTRNTITHLQLVTEADKIRMGEMKIIGSTQPFWHVKAPGFYHEVEQPFLGDERALAAYPVRSLIDNGVLVTFSSDSPVTPEPHPFYGVELAVTRNLECGDYGVPDIDDIDDPTWLRNPLERITVKEAIEAFTINSAFQMGMEEQIGSLAVGKWADMVIVSQDPFRIEPIKLNEIEIIATIFAGEIVYETTSGGYQQNHDA